MPVGGDQKKGVDSPVLGVVISVDSKPGSSAEAIPLREQAPLCVRSRACAAKRQHDTQSAPLGC